MLNDTSGEDPKTIWQRQSTESSQMNFEKIRQKMGEVRANARKQLLGTFVAPIAVAVFYLVGRTVPSAQGTLQPLFTLALAWSVAGLYFLNRGAWRALTTGDVGSVRAT